MLEGFHLKTPERNLYVSREATAHKEFEVSSLARGGGHSCVITGDGGNHNRGHYGRPRRRQFQTNSRERRLFQKTLEVARDCGLPMVYRAENLG